MTREFCEETGGVLVPPTRWDHFLTLKDDEKTFVVYNFCTEWLPLDALPISQLDEPVSFHKFSELSELPLISNLPWIIPMADKSHQHDWPYLVIEKKKNPGIKELCNRACVLHESADTFNAACFAYAVREAGMPLLDGEVVRLILSEFVRTRRNYLP
jgi:hypothetical protein